MLATPDPTSSAPAPSKGARYLFKSSKAGGTARGGSASLSGHQPHDGARRASAATRRRPQATNRPQTAYFVYMLVGVHLSYEEAEFAYAKLRFARGMTVFYERNVNGAGKCKTWLAVSQPFNRRPFADTASRQIALYAGDGAVSVRRGVIP